MPKTLAKRVSNGFGLLDDSQTKYLNGIALGWLPDFTVAGSVATINNALDRPMSIIGDYVRANTDSRLYTSMVSDMERACADLSLFRSKSTLLKMRFLHP